MDIDMPSSLGPGPLSDADEASLGRLLHGRWSCRAFDPAPVPRALIERLLTLAQRTPSWCNMQPWHLVLTSGEATRRLAEALSARARTGVADAPDIPFPDAYRDQYLARRRECGFQLYQAVGVARGDREAGAAQAAKNFEFFGAPHFVLVTAPRELGPYAWVDCGGFVSVFLLAAQALGLGAVPQAAISAHSEWLRDYFGLNDDRVVVCGISFGRALTAEPVNEFRTSRAPLPEVVDWRD